MKAHSKGILPIAVVAIGAGLAGWIFASRPAVEKQSPEISVPLVRVVEVRTGRVPLAVRTHGTVAPRTETALTPEVSGPVVWVSPELVSGGFFVEGDPLLRIETTDFEVILEEARANLARAESEASRARKELERQRTLAARNVASAARLDDAENGAKVAEAALRHARAALRKAQQDLSRTEIRAPFRGRVREEHVDLGQFVNRGVPVATVYAIDYAEVRLPVPDDELAYVDLSLHDSDGREEGPEVRLFADFAGSRHAWLGRVVRTEGEIDPRSRMVHVVARVDDPYGPADGRPPLNVGLFVEAEIAGRVVEDAAVLPRAALREGDRILVVDADDRLRFRNVDVVRRSRDEVVVRGDLRDGERVCVSQVSTVVEGMPVRVLDAADAPGRDAP